MMQKQLLSFFLMTISALLLVCCGVKNTSSSKVKTDFKSYYYPVESLIIPKVYHFSVDDEKTGDLYWVLSTVTENNKTYLLTDSYAMDTLDNLNHVEVIKEEINKKGAFVKEYIETQRNQIGQKFKSPAVMESEGVFLWDLKETEDITWKFKNESKVYPDYDVETYRKRKFTGESLTIEFEGKITPAIIFSDEFRVIYINRLNNQRNDIGFTQTSYYAKGIGLYKYTRVFPERKVTFTLKEILSLEEWEKMKQ
ncbi:MAG: hypothetical protein WDZ45_04625 [Flavobacteriaceae bacterium]